MSVLKTINRLRKALMKLVTGGMGSTRLKHFGNQTGLPGIRTVLVSRPNHRLGNQLLITPLLQELEATLPNARVDIFVKGGVAPVLLAGYRNVGNIIQLPKKPGKNLSRYVSGWLTLRKQRYDIVINVVNHSSSGRLSAQFTNARYKFLGEINDDIRARYPDHEHMAKYPVYSFRNYISELGYPTSKGPVPPLDLKLSDEEKTKGKELLRELVGLEQKTIAIYTYATGAKCYSAAWWETFYQRLLSEYKNHRILEVLPVENVSQIAFKAPSFYSKDLRQIASLIANTEVFIGADSGMMHLASASGAPTIGLFKATNYNTYAPYNDGSVALHIPEDPSGRYMDKCIEAIGAIIAAHATRI